jgi:PAS domain S-box-containing protein
MSQKNDSALPIGVLASALNTIQHGVLVCGFDGIIKYANPAMESISGYGREQLCGMRLSQLFMDDDTDLLYPNLLHLGKTCQRFQGELMLKRDDGSGFFAYLTLDTCPEGQAGSGLIIVGVEDIHRRKELEKILEKTHHQELVTIADSIAHELRNPLVGIGGFVNRMYKACRLDVSQEQYYDFIIHNLRRIEGLVKQVNDLVTLPVPEYHDEKLSTLVIQSLECFSQEIRRRGIELKLAVDEVHLRVDGGLLIKCLCILVGNALEAMPEGGPLDYQGFAEWGEMPVKHRR